MNFKILQMRQFGSCFQNYPQELKRCIILTILGTFIWGRKIRQDIERALVQWFILRMDQFTPDLGNKMRSTDMEFIFLEGEIVTGTCIKGSLRTTNRQVTGNMCTPKAINMMETGKRIGKKEWGEFNSMMGLSTAGDGLITRWMEWADILM